MGVLKSTGHHDAEVLSEEESCNPTLTATPRVSAGRVDRLFRCPLADPEPSAGNDRFQGEAWLLNRSAVGHEQTVVTSTEQTFERLLFFGTCRMANAHNSGMKRSASTCARNV
jgi:hypothetical protein